MNREELLNSYSNSPTITPSFRYMSLPTFCGFTLLTVNLGGGGGDLVLTCQQEVNHTTDHMFDITFGKGTTIKVTIPLEDKDENTTL